ncbi:MAG TPA: hypothetical protein DEQ75_02590 [Alphaproteobacteria bacterium]|nr:hypothetical protein [Alphaproteobacteria bacterium]
MTGSQAMPTLRALILTVFMLGSAAPVEALEIIRGKAIQGGLVIISVADGSSLTANNTPLMISPGGLAAIGFHRDETDSITLEETAPDGKIMTLTLTPEVRQYKEQRINGLPGKMVTPPEAVMARISRDSQNVRDARAHASPLDAFSKQMDWPTRGIITGVYGSRRILNGQPRAPHYGIDIAAPKGTPVIAPQDGIITMVDDLYFTGWTIIMDHGHGLSSTFLHLDQTAVEEGQTVKRGEALGTVGSSGRSTGPHLDWRINLFEKRLDPMLVAGPMP